MHATLQPALSIRPLVGRSVGRLVGHVLLFFMILFLWPHCSCPNGLVTSNMAPAHPHATLVDVYPALFFNMIGGTISLTIPKLKDMEEGLVSPHWLFTTRITPSFAFISVISSHLELFTVNLSQFMSSYKCMSCTRFCRAGAVMLMPLWPLVNCTKVKLLKMIR